jgi:hypothetical protein
MAQIVNEPETWSTSSLRGRADWTNANDLRRGTRRHGARGRQARHLLRNKRTGCRRQVRVGTGTRLGGANKRWVQPVYEPLENEPRGANVPPGPIMIQLAKSAHHKR